MPRADCAPCYYLIQSNLRFPKEFIFNQRHTRVSGGCVSNRLESSPVGSQKNKLEKRLLGRAGQRTSIEPNSHAFNVQVTCPCAGKGGCFIKIVSPFSSGLLFSGLEFFAGPTRNRGADPLERTIARVDMPLSLH